MVLTLRGFVPLGSDSDESPAILTDYITRGSLDKLIKAERKAGKEEKRKRGKGSQFTCRV
jgi:hypothetical protein